MVGVIMVKTAQGGAIVDVVNEVRALRALVDMVGVQFAAMVTVVFRWPAALSAITIEHGLAPRFIFRGGSRALEGFLGSPEALRAAFHRRTAHWLVVRLGLIVSLRSETHVVSMLRCSLAVGFLVNFRLSLCPLGIGGVPIAISTVQPLFSRYLKRNPRAGQTPRIGQKLPATIDSKRQGFTPIVRWESLRDDVVALNPHSQIGPLAFSLPLSGLRTPV